MCVLACSPCPVSPRSCHVTHKGRATIIFVVVVLIDVVVDDNVEWSQAKCVFEQRSSFTSSVSFRRAASFESNFLRRPRAARPIVAKDRYVGSRQLDPTQRQGARATVIRFGSKLGGPQIDRRRATRTLNRRLDGNGMLSRAPRCRVANIFLQFLIVLLENRWRWLAQLLVSVYLLLTIGFHLYMISCDLLALTENFNKIDSLIHRQYVRYCHSS